MRRVIAIALFAASVLCAFAIGSYVGARSDREVWNARLQGANAVLWFNHLMQYREIESDLVRGCEKEALEKTRIAIDIEMRLLASFHREFPDSPMNKYISDRAPALLDDLKVFKSTYGDSWNVPQCPG